VVNPTRLAPSRAAERWSADLAAAGATNVAFPLVDRRSQSQDPHTAQLIHDAAGIFLGGGDQVHLVAVLAGSRVGQALKEAFARGAIIAGTSAGAAALSEMMLAGGERREDGTRVPTHLGPGLGLLRFSTVVDTHFAQRRRLQRLFRCVAENPELLGLGIDEDTGLVVRGSAATVIGPGSVTYVDGRSVQFDNIEEVMTRGVPLTLSHLRVGVVGAGYTFDLRERELEVVLNAAVSR
jgi:cyanophycinase